MKHLLFIVTSAEKIGTGNINDGYEFSEIADLYIELTFKRKSGLTMFNLTAYSPFEIFFFRNFNP